MGNWENVSVVWREVYATAALLKALVLLREGESRKALEELDRGILLGAPILDSALHSLAASLTDKSHKDYINSATTGSSSRGEDSVVSVCKPGAAGGRKKIVFRNYKPLRECEETVFSDKTKRPRLGVDVHDLASRTANVPVVDAECKIPLTYLPSLETFHLKYMLAKIPVVISGAMDTWPAYSARKWRCVYHVRVKLCVSCSFLKYGLLCSVHVFSMQFGVSETGSWSTHCTGGAGCSLY